MGTIICTTETVCSDLPKAAKTTRPQVSFSANLARAR